MHRTAPYGPQDGGYRSSDRSSNENGRDTFDKRDKEKPTRSLFVRNIPYDATQTELTELFGAYGKLSRFFNLISTRGMAFVTYYDLRAADRAKKALQNHIVRGRPISLHYSLPKEGEATTMKDGSSEEAALMNLGTLFVIFKDVQGEITNADLQELFSQWGEVHEIRDGKGKIFLTKFVDFWDTRDAVKAAAAANGMAYRGGIMEARFALPGKPEKKVSAGPDRGGPRGADAYRGPGGYPPAPYAAPVPYSSDPAHYYAPPPSYPPYDSYSAQPYYPPAYNYPPPPSGSVPAASASYPPIPPYPASQPSYAPPSSYLPPSAGSSSTIPTNNPSVAPQGVDDHSIMQQISALSSMLNRGVPPPTAAASGASSGYQVPPTSSSYPAPSYPSQQSPYSVPSQNPSYPQQPPVSYPPPHKY